MLEKSVRLMATVQVSHFISCSKSEDFIFDLHIYMTITQSLYIVLFPRKMVILLNDATTRTTHNIQIPTAMEPLERKWYTMVVSKLHLISLFEWLIRGTVTLCYIQVYDFQLTQRQAIHIAAVIMVRIPLCCMPRWHAHPTRHVEEFWVCIVTIRVPSIFVLNRQISRQLMMAPVSTPKVNELFIKDTLLPHNAFSNIALTYFNVLSFHM